jgi:hypothetical protein
MHDKNPDNVWLLQESLWWSTITPISIKQTTTSHLKALNIKKTKTYGFKNPGHGLGQAQKCDRVKPVKWDPNPPSDNWIYNDNTDTNKQ